MGFYLNKAFLLIIFVKPAPAAPTYLSCVTLNKQLYQLSNSLKLQNFLKFKLTISTQLWNHQLKKHHLNQMQILSLISFQLKKKPKLFLKPSPKLRNWSKWLKILNPQRRQKLFANLPSAASRCSPSFQ